MAKKQHQRTEKTRKSHAGWRGSFVFGLVTFPVEAYNALDPRGSDIRFHQIHAKCHERIYHQKVCPVHGEVANNEIVSGYEYHKDKYVEVDPAELAALRSEGDRALKIDAFVSPDGIDPLYFDGRMYYLVPAEAVSNEPYTVILEAMKQENRYGIAHLIFSGKDQIALIRPMDGLLHMAMLNFAAEIRPPKDIAAVLRKPKNIDRQVRLARTLIEDWSQDYLVSPHMKIRIGKKSRNSSMRRCTATKLPNRWKKNRRRCSTSWMP
jgi:DNA end-binding protein Ku